MAKQNRIMNTKHPQWAEFCSRLDGKEGCNFHEKKKGDPKSVTWKCKGGTDKSLAEAILKNYYPSIDIPATFKYFEKNGGFCDCEILFNVNR